MVRTLNTKFAILTILCVWSHRIKKVQNTVWQIPEPAHLANIKQLCPPRQHLPRTLPQPWAAILLFAFSMNVTGGGHGNPLQCSSLENPLDRGAWWVTVRGIAKSRARLERLTHTGMNVILPAASYARPHAASIALCLACCPEHGVLEAHPCRCRAHNCFPVSGRVILQRLHPSHCMYAFIHL